MIPRGQDTCDWCGHKKDDEEGFFPYPHIFKPPLKLSLKPNIIGFNRNSIEILKIQLFCKSYSSIFITAKILIYTYFIYFFKLNYFISTSYFFILIMLEWKVIYE